MKARDVSGGRLRVEAGRSLSTFRIAMLVAGVVMLIVAAVVWSSFIDSTSTNTNEPATVEGVVGVESIRWTGDGRFAVLQTFEADNTPAVVAWNRETGQTTTATGHHLAATEPASSLLWLIPMNAEEYLAAFAGGTQPGYPFDGPPPALVVWDPSRPEIPPSDLAPARYEPYPGGDGWTAYFEVDILKGSHPSRMLINNAASSGEGHRAELPDDLGTFAVVGWSPSGKYVAIEELLSFDEWRERRYVVVEASSGRAVSVIEAGEAAHGSPAWLGESDLLVWVDGAVLMSQVPGGTPMELGAVSSADLPPSLQGAFWLDIVGYGRAAVMVLAEHEEGRELSMVTPNSSSSFGIAQYTPFLDWDPVGGLLEIADTPDRAQVVLRSDPSIAGTTIIEGPLRRFLPCEESK